MWKSTTNIQYHLLSLSFLVLCDSDTQGKQEKDGMGHVDGNDLS